MFLASFILESARIMFGLDGFKVQDFLFLVWGWCITLGCLELVVVFPLDFGGAVGKLVRSGVEGGCVAGWEAKIGALTIFSGFGGDGVPDLLGNLHLGFSVIGGDLLLGSSSSSKIIDRSVGVTVGGDFSQDFRFLGVGLFGGGVFFGDRVCCMCIFYYKKVNCIFFEKNSKIHRYKCLYFY